MYNVPQSNNHSINFNKIQNMQYCQNTQTMQNNHPKSHPTFNPTPINPVNQNYVVNNYTWDKAAISIAEQK